MSAPFDPPAALEYAINHVFLPPKTPQKDDTGIVEEHHLIDSLLESAKKFCEECSTAEAKDLGLVIRMLERLLKVKPGVESSTKRTVMKTVIQELSNGERALFHIRAQNAGLLLTGRKDDILIEAFELLAPNKNVMSFQGRLIREFPSRAAAVGRNVMLDDCFLDELVNVLCRLELQASPVTRPKTWKSGREFDEERDTESPSLVTSLVIGVLVGLGQSVESQRVAKRSREQVNWDSTLLSFHRSSTWLLLRVALRLVLDRDASQDAHHSLYKALTTLHHARLLQQAAALGLKSDIRFAMAAKIARRLKKLNPQESLPWVQLIKDSITANHGELQQRWRRTQSEDVATPQPGKLEQLSFYPDTNLRLVKLNPHLSWVQSRAMGEGGTAGPGDQTLSLVFPAHGLPTFPALGSLEDSALLELESWIESNPYSWATKCVQNTKNSITKAESVLQKLQELIAQYYTKASKAYDGNPEALSVMFLNVMDLWVAMDKVAGSAVPLLLEYDPGFPPDFLRPLILPNRCQMARLHNIEVYFHNRRKAACNGYPPAFANLGRQGSFAVRYFDSSPTHQELLDRIVAESESKQASKILEYRRTRNRYDELSRRAASSTHDQEWNAQAWRDVCKSGCESCRLARDIANLRIDIFEWPLPEDRALSKAIVFEICVPKAVMVWRDVTTDLFLKIFRDPGSLRDAGKLWRATTHSGLSRFNPISSQVQLASTIKPVEASHYRGKHIGQVTSEAELSVRPDWRNYGYYEAASRTHHGELFKGLHVPTKCSLAEHQCGRHLTSWTRSTGHTSNAVVAAQSDCPPAMSLEEFRALGHVRSDPRLQWANILCQLTAPSLNWNHESTYWLVLQACLEAGPSDSNGSVLREAHADLLDDGFVHHMVVALTDALDRFRENWQNDIAVSLLTRLATRVLSLTTSAPDIEPLLGFLSQARQVALAWAWQLLEGRAACETKDDRTALDRRVLMAALTCMSTFDIEPYILHDLLQSADDLAAFVEAAIITQDHLPTTGLVSHPVLLMLSHRWRRAMHMSLEFVKGEVIKNNPGFHQAIQRFWADYSPSVTRWSTLSGQQAHILDAKMCPENSAPIGITFNVLDGRLLVDGYPLSRLPSHYESQLAYKELFGPQILEVMPSTREGMRFSACRDQQGWVVHFAMVGSDLVIQAVRRRGATSAEEESSPEVCEFIPSWKLKDDVPDSFICNYSHWLNLSTGVVEFRPAGKPWVSSSDNWTLTRDGGRNILSRHGCYVIDPHSPTAEALLDYLKSIEARQNLDMIFHPADHVLIVDLPRFSLSFSLAEGGSSIKSKHYSGMHIDECQTIGALVGLQNKLVLKQDGAPQRLVLVPRGPLSSSLVSNHVKVGVHLAAPHLKHDAFAIDSRLGRITSRGSLSSKLYLCYLHALTSHCLPDPLTGRTGTEEALRILRSASVRSFQQLDAESYGLLCDIAKLSPKRLFYPQHLTDMEQVEWSNRLPVLSQHEAFGPEVEAIFDHARDCKLLHQGTGDPADSLDLAAPRRSSALLIARAKIRNATFRVFEFGAEDHTDVFDRRYLGRHRKHGDIPETWTFTKTSLATKRLASGAQQLLDPPSAQLREDILAITGLQFQGHPAVDLTFSLEYLRPAWNSLAGRWCGLHRTLTEEPSKYKITFFLAALIHAKGACWDVVQTLMAFAIAPNRFQATVTPPEQERFNLDYNISTMRGKVDAIVKKHLYPVHRCPEADLARGAFETENQASKRRHQTWKSKSDEAVKSFISDIEAQWKQGWTVSKPNGNQSVYMHVNNIMDEVRDALELARRTSLFHEYLDGLVRELDHMGVCSEPESDQDASTPQGSAAPVEQKQQTPQLRFVHASALFSRPAPATERPQPVDFTHLCDQVAQIDGDKSPLTSLFDQLERICSQKAYQIAYIDELRSSSGSTVSSRRRLGQGATALETVFEDYLLQCKQAAEKIRSSIDEVLRGQSIADTACQGTSLYPRISPSFLLQRLTRGFWDDLSTGWQACLVNYGLSLAYLQRAERLVSASRRPEKRADLLKELLNMGSHGCDEGDPLAFPENLVLELEQGILIRPVQQRIAANMRAPPDGKNSVMQLNMGEGKSSVIVPIVSASLADGERLVRVVVAKPQSKQMMHTLISTLGGLIDRRVFYLPISRALQLGTSEVLVVQRMLKTCKKEGGVLLVQPEHLLSFKLMGLERIWTDGARAGTLGKQILSTYRDFDHASRDIVDESDENFSVKFELIYTIGPQKSIDMSPERWTMIQELMDLMLEIASKLTNGPEAGKVKGLLFDEDTASGRFPTIRVLEESAGKLLVDALAEQVCRTGLRGFPIQHQSKQMRQAVLDYILQPNLSPEQVAAVEAASSGFFSEASSKNVLLLLRGLLATNVILFALGQKRFRVNYGLAPDRRPATMLAVPYRAKDSPAPRSEFSHPDVVIVLTCLSYYYQGLSYAELSTCLEKLSRSDQAEQEYSRWAAASPTLPSSLSHFSGVNLKNSTLCKKRVFPALRYAKPAIDFYLAAVVFPKEMREFPYKLSASGWDLGKTKRHPLTGFSGTTDSKYVLPLSVTALDLPEQRHTNSAVLACLLREENTVLELGGDEGHLSALTVDMLLTAVTTSAQPMRVILDVGAQIIELDNVQVARRWLALVPSQDADAVIFFNDHDELSVLTRNNVVDSFLTSPFATQTDRCLVFLDQAHTRGTDLKLPDLYRAAVTLGPGVTKDTLVQACMRMRKLGNGQSVTFCVSPEMQKRIRSLANLTDPRPLTVTDILVCAIAETWDDAHRSLPLWATQGIRHQHQEVVWDRVDKTGELSVDDAKEYLEDEAQTLEQRYRPISEANGASNSQSLTSKLIEATKLDTRQDQVSQIKEKCAEVGLANLDAMGSLQEEQERELAPEVERERQVERPPPRLPAPHALHEHVRCFATSGVMTPKSPAFMPAFQALASTSAAALFPAESFPSELLVTADFATTVQTNAATASSSSDSYQRPVQWVLTQSDPSSAHGMHMVIISSWEANELKAILETTPPTTYEEGRQVFLRAYLPRSSLSFPSLEDLTLYTIPSTTTSPLPPPAALVTQLNLFAGQLYLRSHAEYIRLCRFLGLSYAENEGDSDVAADGFVGKQGGKGYEACAFTSSPVGFLSVLFKRVRRDCLDIEKTHMGRILTGEILRERDFQFEGGGSTGTVPVVGDVEEEGGDIEMVNGAVDGEMPGSGGEEMVAIQVDEPADTEMEEVEEE